MNTEEWMDKKEDGEKVETEASEVVDEIPAEVKVDEAKEKDEDARAEEEEEMADKDDEEEEDETSIDETSDAGLDETVYELDMDVDAELIGHEQDTDEGIAAREEEQHMEQVMPTLRFCAFVIVTMGCLIFVGLLLSGLRSIASQPPLRACTMEHYAKDGASFGQLCEPPKLNLRNVESLESYIRIGYVTLVSEKPDFVYRDIYSGELYRYHENDDRAMIKTARARHTWRKEYLKKEEEAKELKMKEKEAQEKIKREMKESKEIEETPCTMEHYTADGKNFGQTCKPPSIREHCNDWFSNGLRNGTITLVSEKPHFIYLFDGKLARYHADDDMNMINIAREAIKAREQVLLPKCTMDYYANEGRHFGKPCRPPHIVPGRKSIDGAIRRGIFTLASEHPHFVYRGPSTGTLYRLHEDNDMEMIKIVRKAIATRKEILQKEEESRAMEKEFEPEKRIREEKEKRDNDETPCTIEHYKVDGLHYGQPCKPPGILEARESLLDHLIRSGQVTLVSEEPHFVYRAETNGVLLRYHKDEDIEKIKIARKAIASRKETLKMEAEKKKMKREDEEKIIKAEKKEKEKKKKEEKENRIREQNERYEAERKMEERNKIFKNFALVFGVIAMLASFVSIGSLIETRWPTFTVNKTMIRRICLTKTEDNGFGFALKGHIIVKVIEGGVAALQGQLKCGDEIIAVNQTNVETLSRDDIVKLINASNTVNLFVRSNPNRSQ
ncbi:hypothetical protein PENTCL1PPCAC_10285 [Pristionchus entomophagus]|uniref:PDZ domain-containing protein n=1 Tax=Pristionchus entomophagus TaxID=358040 RepID=A0AAV5T750_9BILA|nr:hypothetical protein PENTCL1PPCAC_10285 [Pristionchus entomophagus]